MRRRQRASGAEPHEGQSRLLVPFTAGDLDPAVLEAAIRIAKTQQAVLVPAYLLVVPLEFAPESPVHGQVAVAMPLLEAVELAAAHAGVLVDARIERGRTPIHALQKLWEVETFDRVLIPAPTPGRPGFSPKELAWMLTHAPSETLILRPAPDASGAGSAQAKSPSPT
jgi:hypothetical protein